MEIKRSGSQASAKPAADYFTGTVRIDPLFQPPPPARALGASVTFEPRARTAWHTHPLGQTLIVTAGCGCVQSWGGPVEEIRPGDVVWFPPGEKHWHGATPTTAHDPHRHSEAARRQDRRLDGTGDRRAVPGRRQRRTNRGAQAHVQRESLLRSPARRRRSPAPRFRGAIRPTATCRSRSSSAASATPTSTWSATSGAASCRPSTRSSRATRSSAASPRSARRSRSTSPATSSASAAWSIRTGPAPSARRASSSSARTMTLTYNSPDKHLGGVTYGGYSESIVVDEHFVLRVPSNLDLAGGRAAPLRRDHDLLAAAPLGRHARARRSASSASAASATWA